MSLKYPSWVIGETVKRNMTQMKEQVKTPEKEANKMEMSNLSFA